VTIDNPPIQEPAKDIRSGLFPQTWILWFQSVQDQINEVLSTVRGLSGKTRNTSNTAIDNTSYHWFGNTDGGAFTYTLPAGVDGRSYRIVNTGASGNDLTITPNGSEDLLGANSSSALSDGEALVIVYDTNDGWY